MSLIAANVAFFVYAALKDPAALSGSITEAHVDLGLYKPFLEGGGEWYRLVTSGFMHFGLIHIAFNMYLLYLLGQMLEPALGRVKFLLVYFAGLLGGSAGALIVDRNAISAGASGAVFGLMALAFVGYYLQGINPLRTSIGTLLVMNLVITFMFPNISIGGHLGGALAGGLCAFVVMSPNQNRFPKWVGYAAPLLVSVLAIAISVASVG